MKKIFVNDVRKYGDHMYIGEWDKYSEKHHGFGYLYTVNWLYECYFVQGKLHGFG